MMSEANLQLLTAAVDGELSPAQQVRLAQLLRQSPEAAQLYAQLQSDTHRLKTIPAVTAPIDFSRIVMASIRDGRVQPNSASSPLIDYLPAWITVACAAAVLIVISIGSYLYFATSDAHLRHREMVERGQRVGTPVVPVVEPAPTIVAKAEPNHPITPVEIPAVVVQLPVVKELLPAPKIVESDALLSPSAPPLVPRVVGMPRLPLLLALRDLDQQLVRAKLDRELLGDETYRLELFCKDTSRALTRIEQTMKSDQRLLIDGSTAERLKKGERFAIGLFIETMTGPQLAEFLAVLGTADQAIEKKKSGEGQFDKFVLTAARGTDIAEIGQMLGIPASQVLKGKVTQVPNRPFTQTTAEQLAEKLSRTNASPSPGAKTSEPAILVTNYPPNLALAMTSAQVRTFNEQRKDRKDGALSVLVVLKSIK